MSQGPSPAARSSASGPVLVVADLTWTCHGCGEERPDAAISVIKRPVALAANVDGEVRLRYCNDRPQCAVVVAGRVEEMIAQLTGTGPR